MSQRKTELATAIVVGLLCAYGVYESLGYSGQSAIMPVAVTGIATLLCAVWAVQSGLAVAGGRDQPYKAERRDFVFFAIVCAITMIYVFGITYIGFFTSTLVMVPGLAFILGYRNWLISVLTTIGFGVVLYVVFKIVLSIPLPPEVIVQGFGG